MAKGVVAAGHELTAEAGAAALREGGNAVDAAVGAVLASLVCESPLTGLGAGGYMLVHEPSGESVLLDFFVAAPGLDGRSHEVALEVVPVHFNDEVSQDFYVGPASCAVPGTPAGLCEALRRFGTVPMQVLAEPAIEAAREGVEVNEQQGYLHQILIPILAGDSDGAAIFSPKGAPLGAGSTLRNPALAEAIARLADEGHEPFYEGEVAAAIAERVGGAGGALGRDDLAAYEPIAREPVRGTYRGAEVLTNPPPASGGLLICLSLAILDRFADADPVTVVAASERVQAIRGRDYYDRLYGDAIAAELLAPDAVDAAATELAERLGPAEGGELPGDRLGSTTHITAVDANGMCASVTCSNGSGSGVFVPGTGIHLNNMLGEQDLSPLGFHGTPAGRRMPSMMSPTAIVRDGELLAALGSGGSNRIRSAILETVLGLLARDLPIEDAVRAPRFHFEDGVVEAEPGIDPAELARIEARGIRVHRWADRNLFFGGVHAVARDPASGQLRGAGDPRRGGAVAVA